MNDRVPVLVVGGFLGSGKTTVVRHLLATAQARGTRLAVVSNEFGELGIDAALIGATGMVELSGGCVCCTLSDELVNTLQDLREKVDPDQIVIECSGLALPFDTQLHLYRPPVRDWVGDEACVVVVDAERWGEEDALFAEQVQSADLVLLSKVDLVDEASRLSAHRRMKQLANDVEIIDVIHGNVSPELLFPAGPRVAPRREHHHHDHQHADWVSEELAVPAGMSLTEATAWIEARRGVRTKGFVSTSEGPMVVQGVGRRLELVPPAREISRSLLGRVVVIRHR